MPIDRNAQREDNGIVDTPIDDGTVTPTLANFFVTILSDHCDEQGLPADKLFGLAGLEADDLNDPEQRFPLSKFFALCEVAAKSLDDPHIGLHVGTRISADYLGPYGYALMSSNTLREMMRKAERYSVLAIGGGSNVFELRDELCIRYWRHRDADSSRGWRILDELVMASAVTMTQTLTGNDQLIPQWVSFPFAQPKDTRPYESVFQCPLRFNCDAHAIAFDATLLDVEIRRVHPQVKQQLDQLCDDLLARLANSKDPEWLTRCRSLIASALASPPPELGSVAADLGISASTLRRRLSNRSTTFRHLVDDIRKELAIEYLNSPNLSLIDIAYLLGFSEQSAFQRAFKRWTGHTPGEYRQKVG